MKKRLEEKLNSLLLQATHSVAELFTKLDEEGVSLAKIQQQVWRVHKSRAKLENFWRENESLFRASNELVEKVNYARRHIYAQVGIERDGMRTAQMARADEKTDRRPAWKLEQNLGHLSSPCMIVRVEDSEFTVEDTNLAFQRILGFSRKELVGVSLNSLIVKEQFDLYKKATQSGLEALQDRSSQIYFKHKTGFVKVYHTEHKIIKAYHEVFVALVVQEAPEVQKRTRILINSDGDIKGFDSGMYTVFPRLIKFPNHRSLKAYLKNADGLFDMESSAKNDPF